jgi:predicted MPP superfamily phosphohydrolase
MKKNAILKTYIAMAVVVPAAITAQILPKTEPKDTKPFSIIVLPDTQLYALNHPKIFFRQTEWIKQQKEALNIVAVIHEGDITHNNTEEEWKIADQAMSTLDDVVPYCVVVGNHDGGTAPNRDGTALFNKYFGPRRFEKESWYGAHFGRGNENAYYFIHAAGMNLLILCLEFAPRDQVLKWANEVVAKHKHYRTIVVTHVYTDWNDTRIGKGNDEIPRYEGYDANHADDMWEKFVKKHQGIFLVLSGHILNDGLGRLTSVGDNGNKVHQILANYQMRENGGNGWLRIMKFLPSKNRIAITTYSPVLDQYEIDPQNKFELGFEMDPVRPADSEPSDLPGKE